MDGDRFDDLAARLAQPDATRRTLLRRAGVGGFAALLAALGLLEAGSSDVAAGRRRRRRRRGGGGGGGAGGGGSSSSSSSAAGGGGGGGGGGGSSSSSGGGSGANNNNNNNNNLLDGGGDGTGDGTGGGGDGNGGTTTTTTTTLPPNGECPPTLTTCASPVFCPGGTEQNPCVLVENLDGGCACVPGACGFDSCSTATDCDTPVPTDRVCVRIPTDAAGCCLFTQFCAFPCGAGSPGG